jgi:hypothetical protein
MIILGLEFLALIVICYVFLVYVTRNRVSAGKGKLIPIRVAGVIIFLFLAFIIFASWYVRLGLTS